MFLSLRIGLQLLGRRVWLPLPRHQEPIKAESGEPEPVIALVSLG
jgi:hypothetical protein